MVKGFAKLRPFYHHHLNSHQAFSQHLISLCSIPVSSAKGNFKKKKKNEEETRSWCSSEAGKIRFCGCLSLVGNCPDAPNSFARQLLHWR